MLVAFDTAVDEAVLGPTIEEESRHLPSSTNSMSGRYTCLQCGASLNYISNPDNLFNYFSHNDKDEDCINDGNISGVHRLGQEVATQRIVNWLPVSQPDINIEKRIESSSTFVISDIVSTQYRLATEILYTNCRLSLRRRLRPLFDRGYGVILVCLTNGRIQPTQIERHLQQKIPSVRVGRFDPQTFSLTLGSVISSSQIDLDRESWNAVPDYLS